MFVEATNEKKLAVEHLIQGYFNGAKELFLKITVLAELKKMKSCCSDSVTVVSSSILHITESVGDAILG